MLMGDADTHADHTLSFTLVGKSNFLEKLLVTALLFTMFYLFHQYKRGHNFKHFEQHIEILWKKGCPSLSYMPGIDTDPDLAK
jgi:hypothetical protein